jgi:hypothetical protein
MTGNDWCAFGACLLGPGSSLAKNARLAGTLLRNPDFACAHPGYQRELLRAPNDTFFASLFFRAAQLAANAGAIVADLLDRGGDFLFGFAELLGPMTGDSLVCQIDAIAGGLYATDLGHRSFPSDELK